MGDQDSSELEVIDKEDLPIEESYLDYLSKD